MTTIFNKLFKKQEKTTLPLDSHVARYVFDFSLMPSVPAYGAPCVFVEGEDNHESFYDCFLKEIKDIPSLTSYVRLKTYGIKEGYLAVLSQRLLLR